MFLCFFPPFSPYFFPQLLFSPLFKTLAKLMPYCSATMFVISASYISLLQAIATRCKLLTINVIGY
uniref:Uncharacterized protein n=1 Tax=Arundo donax TaxID=35708 RepID=A0A0A9EE02_ARUDO